MLSLITRQSISDDSDHLAYYFAATLASKILAFVIAKILIIYKKQTSSNVSLLWLLPFSLLPIGTLIAIFVLTGYMYSQSEIYIIIAVLISDALQRMYSVLLGFRNVSPEVAFLLNPIPI